jgi:eukaryotic-like serine/threonine-protein kinase
MAALAPGTKLGNYRILQPIGVGGMGAVYQAMHESLDRVVALKVITADGDPSFLDRFRQEARTVARLKHPNIVNVYDFGEQDGVTFIVSEYIDGGTLDLRLEHPVRLEYAAGILSQIAAGLDYAHRQGILHRDVKPANILIEGDDERAVITDFGIAKIMQSEAGLTRAGMVLGTPEYMAPEQAMGTAVDARADVYSLAVIAYQMVVGKLPYSATAPLATILAVVNDPLPPPRSINPAVPEVVDAVLCKGLEKLPEDRYASAGELARAFEDAARQATGGLPPSGTFTSPAWVGRVPTSVERPPTPPTEMAAAVAASAAKSVPVSVATGSRVVVESPPAAASPRRSRLVIGAAIAALVALVSVGVVLASTVGNGGLRGSGGAGAPALSTPGGLAPGAQAPGVVPPAAATAASPTTIATATLIPTATQVVIEAVPIPDTPTPEPTEEPTLEPIATLVPTPVPPPPTATRPPPTPVPPRPTATSPPPAPTEPPPPTQAPAVPVEPMGESPGTGTTPSGPSDVPIGPMGGETPTGGTSGAAPTPVPLVQPPNGVPSTCMGCPVPTAAQP